MAVVTKAIISAGLRVVGEGAELVQKTIHKAQAPTAVPLEVIIDAGALRQSKANFSNLTDSHSWGGLSLYAKRESAVTLKAEQVGILDFEGERPLVAIPVAVICSGLLLLGLWGRISGSQWGGTIQGQKVKPADKKDLDEPSRRTEAKRGRTHFDDLDDDPPGGAASGNVSTASFQAQVDAGANKYEVGAAWVADAEKNLSAHPVSPDVVGGAIYSPVSVNVLGLKLTFTPAAVPMLRGPRVAL